MQIANMLFPGLAKSIMERNAKKRKRKERKAKQWTKKGKGKGQVRYAICEYAFSWQSKKHIGKERKRTWKWTRKGKDHVRESKGKEKEMEIDR